MINVRVWIFYVYSCFLLKIQKKNEITKSQLSAAMPNTSSDVKQSLKKSKKAPHSSLVFTNDLVRSETPDTCIDDTDDDKDSGPEFEMKDHNDSIDEIVCSTALHINAVN